MDEKKKTTIKKKKIPKYNPYCPNCDVWRNRDDKFIGSVNYCPDCGTKLIPQSKCPICNMINDGQWTYCASCGVKIIRQE